MAYSRFILVRSYQEGLAIKYRTADKADRNTAAVFVGLSRITSFGKE
jgi:hypothetical protein